QGCESGGKDTKQKRESRRRWYTSSDMDHPEETHLLQQIQANEPGAFDAFVTLCEDRSCRLGGRMCGQREDARDVLQDTLIQAYVSLKDLRHPEALRSW